MMGAQTRILVASVESCKGINGADMHPMKSVFQIVYWYAVACS